MTGHVAEPLRMPFYWRIPTNLVWRVIRSKNQEKDAYQKASNFKKSQFALKYSIDDTDWDTPTYIAEGLKWLVSDINLPVIQKDIDNSVPTVAKAVDNG